MTSNIFITRSFAGTMVYSLAIAGFLMASGNGIAAEEGGVTVIRGTPADTKSIDVSKARKTTVFRGQPSYVAQPVPGEAEAPSPDLDLIGGYDGWFIDYRNNRIVNCYGIQGTQVGDPVVAGPGPLLPAESATKTPASAAYRKASSSGPKPIPAEPIE